MVPILSRLETAAQGGDNAGMEIRLNGAAHRVAEGSTVARLLDGGGFAGRRVGVEVNGMIVPHSQHASHVLQEGDAVEIVQALGGG